MEGLVMKKMVLIVLLMALLGIFVQMIGSNSVFAQDKYGGILKVAEPYGTAGMFGDPLDVRVIEGMYAG
jgi:hypothetical protein